MQLKSFDISNERNICPHVLSILCLVLFPLYLNLTYRHLTSTLIAIREPVINSSWDRRVRITAEKYSTTIKIWASCNGSTIIKLKYYIGVIG